MLYLSPSYISPKCDLFLFSILEVIAVSRMVLTTDPNELQGQSIYDMISTRPFPVPPAAHAASTFCEENVPVGWKVPFIPPSESAHSDTRTLAHARRNARAYTLLFSVFLSRPPSILPFPLPSCLFLSLSLILTRRFR